MLKKLWLPNVEEVLPQNDIHYASVCVPKTLALLPRFLPCLNRGDMLISTENMDPVFMSYMAGVLELGSPDQWFLRIYSGSKPYSIINSILADTDAMARLREMGRCGEWVIEPYLQTSGVSGLADKTKILTDKTTPELIKHGIITRLNDKGYFKDLVRGLGIGIIPGYLAESLAGLTDAIRRTALSNNAKVMLRKTLFSGGLGNLSGTEAELLGKLEGWYNGGRILIEPFLDIVAVAGSVAEITDSGIEFSGVDLQTFTDGKWTGFDFPYPDPVIAGEVKRLSLLIAAAVRDSGARGQMNLDWAFTRKEPEKPLALECNFRQNGFSFVLDFASRYFGISPAGLFINYREGLSCCSMDTSALISRLSKISVNGSPLLLEGPGKKEGAVLMTPPLRGKYGLALFSESSHYINSAWAALKESSL